jgi:hypothetical protein
MSVDVPDSSADVCGGSHMSLAVSSEHAPAEGLFVEGAVDSPNIRAPSRLCDTDDKLDESEPSLNELVEQGNAFCSHLVRMINKYDSWSSLIQHYRKSKK